MIETLADLARYVRHHLPRSLTLEAFRVDESSAAVRFSWEKKEYVVKKSLKVFEVKGRRIYVSGPSLLMHSLLTHHYKNQKVVEAIVEAIREAQRMIEGKGQTETGLQLLKAVGVTLQKLNGRPPKRRTEPSAQKTAPSNKSAAAPAPAIDQRA